LSLFNRQQRISSPKSVPLSANAAPPVPLPAVKFSKVGPGKWEVYFTQIFDVSAAVEKLKSSSFYLVEPSLLQPLSSSTSAANILLSQNVKSSRLTDVLKDSGALITCWTQNEYPQCLIFLESWKQSVISKLSTSSNSSVADAGSSSDSSSSSSDIKEANPETFQQMLAPVLSPRATIPAVNTIKSATRQGGVQAFAFRRRNSTGGILGDEHVIGFLYYLMTFFR
jgi:hypothetical protein